MAEALMQWQHTVSTEYAREHLMASYAHGHGVEPARVLTVTDLVWRGDSRMCAWCAQSFWAVLPGDRYCSEVHRHAVA